MHKVFRIIKPIATGFLLVSKIQWTIILCTIPYLIVLAMYLKTNLNMQRLVLPENSLEGGMITIGDIITNFIKYPAYSTQ